MIISFLFPVSLTLTDESTTYLCTWLIALLQVSDSRWRYRYLPVRNRSPPTSVPSRWLLTDRASLEVNSVSYGLVSSSPPPSPSSSFIIIHHHYHHHGHTGLEPLHPVTENLFEMQTRIRNKGSSKKTLERRYQWMDRTTHQCVARSTEDRKQWKDVIIIIIMKSYTGYIKTICF